MALKTFNLDSQVYKKYSDYCKKEGISMSKKIENFIKKEIENLKITDKKGNINILDNTHKQEEHSSKKYC